MQGEQQAPEPRRPQGFKGLLATPAGKAVAGLAAAFLLGIGAVITDWVRGQGEETAKRVIVSLSGAPIDVRIVPAGAFVSAHPFAPYYVIPRDRVAGPDGVGTAEFERMARQEGFLDVPWAERHGGVPGDPQVVRLELSGKSEEPVTITGLRPRIMRRAAPVDGWYIASPACGVEPVRIAAVDLDAPRPIRGFFDASGRERHLALTVTKTDREQLELHASTMAASIEWKAEISYSAADGRTRSVIVPEGEPFRVTAETDSEGHRPDFTGGRPTVRREHDWDESGLVAC